MELFAPWRIWTTASVLLILKRLRRCFASILETDLRQEAASSGEVLMVKIPRIWTALVFSEGEQNERSYQKILASRAIPVARLCYNPGRYGQSLSMFYTLRISHVSVELRVLLP